MTGSILDTLKKLIKKDAEPAAIAETDFNKQLDISAPPLIRINLDFTNRSGKAEEEFDAWVKEQGLEQYVTIEKAKSTQPWVWKNLNFTMDGHVVKSSIFVDNPMYDEEARKKEEEERHQRTLKEIAEPYDPEMAFVTIWKHGGLPELALLTEGPTTPIVRSGRRIGRVEYSGLSTALHHVWTGPRAGGNVGLSLQVSPEIGLYAADITMPIQKAEELYASLGKTIADLKKEKEEVKVQ